MRTLILPAGAWAVPKYRMLNAQKHMGIDATVVHLNHEYDALTDREMRALHAQGNRSGADPFETFATKRYEQLGLDWDMVWTNDNRETSLFFCEMAQQHGAKIVADCDDWFLDIPKGNSAHVGWYQRKKRTYKALLDMADRVTCSTPFLAEHLDGTVCPNYIIPSEWEGETRSTKDPNECLFVVPAGTGRIEDYLDIEDACRKALDIPHVKMLFIGWMPEWAIEYPAGKVIYSTWFPGPMYQKALRWIGPDVIISPMQHNDFNRAKSNLKWLEAGAVGAAFVGEKFGEYERTIQDGDTGLLASGIGEWTDSLCAIAHDADMRQRLARNGAEEVQSRWTWKAVGKQWKKGVLGHGDNRIRLDHGRDDSLVRAAAG